LGCLPKAVAGYGTSQMRALLELVFTIVAVLVARAILNSLLRGVTNAARMNSSPRPVTDQSPRDEANRPSQATGELHKDPVCGTYVAESTPFRRQISGHTFYYCSGACKDKHALVAR
jgi:YHS domain-containing protein